MPTITLSDEIIESQLFDISQKMILSAKTAPKGRGNDNLYYYICKRDTIEQIAERMKSISHQHDINFFERDANTILSTSMIVILGCRISSLGLKQCGFCGFDNCSNKNNYSEVPCTFNSIDLGIAIGSAVSTALSFNVDNRVMFSVGRAAIDLGILDKEVKVAFGIPLSISSKNIFFDRK